MGEAVTSFLQARGVPGMAQREYRAGRRYSGSRVGRPTSRRRSRKSESFGEAVAGVVINELKGTTGRRIVRGIFGTLFKGR